MSRTIKTRLSIFIQKVKINMLKSKIKKMERLSYLNLWERIELRNTEALLKSLEQSR